MEKLTYITPKMDISYFELLDVLTQSSDFSTNPTIPGIQLPDDEW